MSSSTRLLVLGVVRIFQPVHGYDVRRELLSWRAEEWANVSPGSIYNALASLTKDALIEVVGTAQVGARPERTTYQITAEGDDEFNRMLRDAWWRVRQPIDPLMPALSFLWAMRRDELEAVLRHRISVIEGMRTHGRFARQSHATETRPDHVIEMMHLMDARIASETAWAEALLERLERGEYLTADDPPSKWPAWFRRPPSPPTPVPAPGVPRGERAAAPAPPRKRAAPRKPAKPRAKPPRAGRRAKSG